MTSRPEIRPVMFLSTSHITKDEAGRLDTWEPNRENLPFVGGPISYGWLVYANDEDQTGELEGKWPSLWACMKYARSFGCDYIRFDCDANVEDDLPHYEW